GRFGPAALEYERSVRSWVPRWRPWKAENAPARLYIAGSCELCSDVRLWVERGSPSGLLIIAAEDHPSRDLTRITYDPMDGSAECEGIHAVARAFEHMNFGLAYLGFVLRLPVLSFVFQAIVDAAGGHARRIQRKCS